MGTLALIELAVELLKLAPTLEAGAQLVVDAGKELWRVATAAAAPTEAQLLAYDEALRLAHEALQAS